MAQKRGRPLNTQSARKKLNELFITWLAMPETQELVNGIIQQYEGATDSKSPSQKKTVLKGIPPPPLENFMYVDNFRGVDYLGQPQLTSGELSPMAKLKVVDEWDRMKSKVASPASSPKHGGSGLYVAHQPAPAPLSPHGSHRPQHFAGDHAGGLAATSSTEQKSPTRMSPPRMSHLSLPSPPRERPASSSMIPRFWFPDSQTLSKEEQDKEAKAISAAFRAGPKAKAAKGTKTILRSFKLTTAPNSEWVEFVSKVLGFPGWWATQIFNRLSKPGGEVTHKAFKEWWDKDMATLGRQRRFFNFLKNDPSRDYLLKKDFAPFVQDLLVVHPGLEFLKQTPEFQDKYAETVVIRIFYTVNRACDGKLTFKEYSRSRIHDVMLLLDAEDDINTVTEFFSYEHFYVLYCKFWELDTDHDFYISKEDLLKYNNYSLTETIVDVVFRGVPRPLSSDKPDKMNYEDFTWFCLSEEDKTNDTSLTYWFRCVDLDRDGIISGYEVDYFYAEQKKRMESFLTEQILFDDILCQMIDMINPKDPKFIRLSDIKACPTSGIFFNVLFNLNKFIAFEQRDPFQAHAEKQGPEKTDWDRFARIEYDRMAMEAEQSEELGDGNADSQEWGMGM